MATFTNLLQPNKNAVNPLSNSKPSALSSLTPNRNAFSPLMNKPQQTALSSKIQSTIPSWQNTLSGVMGASSWKPTTTQSVPAGSQSKLPVKKEITTSPTGGKTEVHYDTGTKTNTQNTQKTQNIQNTQNTSSSTGAGAPKTPGLVQQPQTPQYPQYAGLVNQLAQTALGNQAIGQKAQQMAEKAGQQYADIGQRAAGYGSAGTQPVAFGNEAIVKQTGALQQQAVSQGLQQQLAGTAQQLTGQQQTQTGLGTAAGLSAPVQVPYSNQYINPMTGQPISGATSGNLQDAVNSVVAKLQTGQMTYNDAVNALSGYGQGGMNALQQALPSGFNVAQSNTLAGQQGSIKPAFDYANEAMANLENTLGQLGMLQSTNIPAINQGANWFSQMFGLNSDSTRAYKAAAAEARGAIQKLLASTQGGTPTDYVSQSAALLPDEPTPNDIAAAKQTLQALGEAKVGIYGTPGMTGGTSTGGFAETW